MKWSSLSSDEQDAIIRAAAAHRVVDEDDAEPVRVAPRVERASFAQVVAYLRGRTVPVPIDMIDAAYGRPDVVEAVTLVLDLYKKVTFEPRRAAKPDGLISGSRYDETGTRSTIYVHVTVPAEARPVSGLVLRGGGLVRRIPLEDADRIQVMVDLESREFKLLERADTELVLM
jgi:hypothetical protein